MVDSDDGDDMDSEDLVKITAEVVDFRRPYVVLRRSSRCTHCSRALRKLQDHYGWKVMQI